MMLEKLGYKRYFDEIHALNPYFNENNKLKNIHMQMIALHDV